MCIGPLHSCIFPALLALSFLALDVGEATARWSADDTEYVDLTAPAPVSGELTVTLRRFELPEAMHASETVTRSLSNRIGVAGTELAGVRVHLAMPEGIRFERIEARVADGLFLERDASFLRTVGRFLMGVARLLLFGRLVAASEELEVSAGAWALLLGVGDAEQEAVSLRTTAQVKLRRGDERITDHGAFLVCRLVVAANSLSELVDVHVVGVEARSGRPVRYHFPRLVLPGGEAGDVVEEEAWMLTELLVRDAGTRLR